MGKYIPNTDAEQKAMLQESGFSSFDDLFRDIPQEVKASFLFLPVYPSWKYVEICLHWQTKT